MEKLFLFLLITLACFSAAYGKKKKSKYGKWDYKSGQYGPNNWGNIRGGSQCLGSRQSPIDINTMETIEHEFPRFKFSGYDSDGMSGNARPTQMSNNGKTVKILLEGDYFITGGGLPSRFKAVQMHFHWGADWTKGSEHTIDGQPTQGELHIVHYDAVKYRNIGAAIKQPDGLAVLGFMLKMGLQHNHAWDDIIRPLDSVRYVGTAFDFTQQPFTLSTILPKGNKLRKFYRYKGSLTTPGCYESVIWTVFHDPIELSEQQLDKFRTLTSLRAPPSQMRKRLGGRADREEDLILDNFRPIQPHNWRPVFQSFEHEEGSEMESEYESPESDAMYPDYGPQFGAGGPGTGNTGGAGTGTGTGGAGGVANYGSTNTFNDQYLFDMYGYVEGPGGQQTGGNNAYGTGKTNYYDQGQAAQVNNAPDMAGQTNYYGQQNGGNSGQNTNYNYGYDQGLNNPGLTGQGNYYGQEDSGENTNYLGFDYGVQTNNFDQNGGTGQTNYYEQGGQGQTNYYDNNNNDNGQANQNVNEPAKQGARQGGGGFGGTADPFGGYAYGGSFGVDYGVYGAGVPAAADPLDPFATEMPTAWPGVGGSNPGVGGSNPGVGGSNPGFGGSNPGFGGFNPGVGGSNPGAGGSNPGFGGSNPGVGGSQPGFGGIEPTAGGTVMPQFLDTNQNGGQIPDPYKAGHEGLANMAKMWQQLVNGKKANPDDAAYYNADFNPAELNNNAAPGNFNEVENNYNDNYGNYGNGNYANELYNGNDNPYFV